MNDFGKLAFVTNIHDIVNLDIDISIDDCDKNKYWNIIRNCYKYMDSENSPEKLGTTYRCRINGIRVTTSGNRYEAYCLRDAKKKLLKKINMLNGWVLCKICENTSYRRFLVDIFDPITGENLSNILLDPKYFPVIREYN